MSDLFGNHIVGFPTRRLKYYITFEDKTPLCYYHYYLLFLSIFFRFEGSFLTFKLLVIVDSFVFENRGLFFIPFKVPFKIISAQMRLFNQ